MNRLQTSLAPLRQRWQALSARERQLVQVAGGALLALLVWQVLIQPPWRTWRDVPPQRRALELELLDMQRLALEAKALKAQPPVAMAQATEALKAASERLGSQAKLSLVGDRATLTVTDLPPAALRAWLTEVRAGARARPVDLQLQRTDKGLQGTVVLMLGGTPG